MRATIRHISRDGTVQDTITLSGNYRSQANLLCYGLVPHVRNHWTLAPGDTIGLVVREKDGDPVSAEYIIHPPEDDGLDWIVTQSLSPLPPA